MKYEDGEKVFFLLFSLAVLAVLSAIVFGAWIIIKVMQYFGVV